MRKIVLPIVLIFVLPLLTGCLTGTIKGQVLDPEDRPVVGAIVSTDPPTQSIRSTESGFKIENVPTGQYTVKAEKPGYKDGKIRVTVQWNTVAGADIRIEPEE